MRAALALNYGITLKLLDQRMYRDGLSPEAAVGLESPAKYRDTLETVVGCIYLLTHRATGKCYVGLTVMNPGASGNILPLTVCRQERRERSRMRLQPMVG
jgi:hypothetical protein